MEAVERRPEIEIGTKRFRPTEGLQKILETLAVKHNLSPEDVLKRLIEIGKEVALKEDSGEGETVQRMIDGTEKKITVFDNNHKPH